MVRSRLDAMSDGDAEHSRHAPAHSGSHYQPSPQIAVGLLVLFIATLVLVFHFVNPIAVTGKSVAPPSTTTTTLPTTSTTVPHHDVKVQVANGTSTSGFAREITNNVLVTKNWDALSPINGPHVAATIVYYKLGFRWAALLIASEIHVPASAARPYSGIVNQIPGYAGVDVVVILGPNARG